MRAHCEQNSPVCAEQAIRGVMHYAAPCYPHSDRQAMYETVREVCAEMAFEEIVPDQQLFQHRWKREVRALVPVRQRPRIRCAATKKEKEGAIGNAIHFHIPAEQGTILRCDIEDEAADRFSESAPSLNSDLCSLRHWQGVELGALMLSSSTMDGLQCSSLKKPPRYCRSRRRGICGLLGFVIARHWGSWRAALLGRASTHSFTASRWP